MKITLHAATRFVQRVWKKEHYTLTDIKHAQKILQKHFANLVTHRCYVPMPNCKGYVGVIQDNVLVTILQKNSQWRKKQKNFFS